MVVCLAMLPRAAWPAAAPPRTCAGSQNIGSIRLSVEPAGGGERLPVRAVNALKAGEKLHYEPVRTPENQEKAQIAVVLAPQSDSSSKDLIVLGPAKADAPASWEIPKPVNLVALVYGPQGLSVKKLKSLVDKNQEILSQLADYADQTAQVEGLIQALQTSEASGNSLQAALNGFSAQYNVAVPKLDPHAPTDQQASLLLRTLMPSVSNYDPLSSRTQVMQQSAGLAAAVASLFFGSPVGLAAGGASLFQNLHTLMFPDTEFRSAFAQLSTADGLALCAKPQPAKSRTRFAYLWAHRVPELAKPAVALTGTAHVPLGSKSLLFVRADSNTPLRNVTHLREWRLTAGPGSASYPAAVSLAPDGKALEVDLTKTKAPPGKYHLAANWDWDPFQVEGAVFLHPYGNLSAAKLTPESRDKLVEGSGRVAIQLTGTDFEFIDKVAIEKAGEQPKNPQELTFTLPTGKRAGEQTSIEMEVDTSALGRGEYRLLLTQSDGVTHEVPITILPPNPKIDNLPLRTNLGDTKQLVWLKGTGLDRIVALSSPAATVELKPVEAGGTRRGAVVKLAPAAKKGDIAAFEMKVQGLQHPIEVGQGLEVAGPRPRITSVRKSVAQEFMVAIRPDEVPVGSTVSFALSVDNLNADGGSWTSGTAAPALSVEVSCKQEAALRNKLVLAPGETAGGSKLNLAGEGMLFLSLDPGAVGYTGCELTASVTVSSLGTSDAFPLGRVVRLPRIERFALSDEKVGPNLYAGTLTGQDLDTIERAGWDTRTGVAVQSIPAPVAGEPGKQELKVALPWPAPAPHAPVYVWLRGEGQGRATGVKY